MCANFKKFDSMTQISLHLGNISLHSEFPASDAQNLTIRARTKHETSNNLSRKIEETSNNLYLNVLFKTNAS